MNGMIFTCCLVGTMLTVSSCGKPTDEPAPAVEIYNITVGSANATAFTATITGTFSGIDKIDLALGKYGVLYCEKSADVDAKFKTWLESGDYAGCMAFDKGKINRLSYSGTVTGLQPDTEYSFCLFSQSRDSAKREISAVQTFRTKPFAPVMSEVRMDSVRYFDAVAKGGIRDIDDVDAGFCEMGFLLSESEDCNATNSTAYPFTGTDLVSQRFRFQEQLHPSTTFHTRIYINYPTTSGQNAYAYGPETAFNTRDFNETAVDLGLPSGIMWSSVAFGGWDFSVDDTYYTLFQWGASARVRLEDLNLPPGHAIFEEDMEPLYEHWDAASSSCRDIGTEISGTEYDVVHARIGGKWRMPSKADVEELIANCDASNWANNGRKYYGLVKAPNGNMLQMDAFSPYWCGTATGNNDKAYAFTYTAERYNDNFKPGTAKVEIMPRSRVMRGGILPVWDPAMPDE